MGFGHRVYKHGDHRARILEGELRKLAEKKGAQNWMVIYDAIKTSVEKTGEADPKLIAAITHDAIGPNADLRRGILLASFGAALFIIGLLSDADIFGAPVWTLGLVLLLPGGAYIAFHFFIPREPTV